MGSLKDERHSSEHERWVCFVFMTIERLQRSEAEAERGLSDRPPVVMSRGSRDQVF